MDGKQLLEVEEFINAFRITNLTNGFEIPFGLILTDKSNISYSKIKDELGVLIKQKPSDEKFSDVLDVYMKQKNIKSDAEMCSLSYVDKGTFSGIRNNIHMPSLETTIKLILSLGLNEIETQRFMSSACRFFDLSSDRDLAIIYFIRNKIYDLNKLNAALKYLGLKEI
ncbi:MAG: hypothetical protein K0S55_554 [Clostridia bacterium]|nr:hypothetical protein [Clostridia bacterium]